ncbi:MAG TPA: PQQ-binding-like beta-propeller repeat protein, partial [Planctomycetota bacterium]|nr:PQQ-binding-like beta-propeller repeat protein [Planctomycetota bacterium]
MIRRRPLRCLGTLAWLAAAFLQSAWALDVTTFHYDNQRTGANTAETILNQSNVSALTFGKLYERTVSGDIFAQPLYLANVNIGGGSHNVIYVATENNYVYCFDADNSATPAYWTRSDLGAPAPRTDIIPWDTNYNTVIGITSTPVIDRASGTIYTVSMNKDAPGVFNFRLWAMDLATGANKTGSPTVVTATNFDPTRQAQRSALTLANGKLYIAFASFSDQKQYSGYIISYNPTTLAKLNEFLTCPSCVGAGNNGDFGAGIWMSGCGPAVDASGNLYVVTGNGTVNTTNAIVAGTNYGESIVKLDQNLAVVDFYTPQNRDYLNNVDADLGV